jgi:hypothetical protein
LLHKFGVWITCQHRDNATTCTLHHNGSAIQYTWFHLSWVNSSCYSKVFMLSWVNDDCLQGACSRAKESISWWNSEIVIALSLSSERSLKVHRDHSLGKSEHYQDWIAKSVTIWYLITRQLLYLQSSGDCDMAWKIDICQESHNDLESWWPSRCMSSWRSRDDISLVTCREYHCNQNWMFFDWMMAFCIEELLTNDGHTLMSAFSSLHKTMFRKLHKWIEIARRGCVLSMADMTVFVITWSKLTVLDLTSADEADQPRQVRIGECLSGNRDCRHWIYLRHKGYAIKSFHSCQKWVRRSSTNGTIGTASAQRTNSRISWLDPRTRRFHAICLLSPHILE